jgi:hypothetical protein
MKVQNWWVKKGILTSSTGPGPELSLASEQFPDEYDPMVFMTGDGHRHPPFEWSNRGARKGFFMALSKAIKYVAMRNRLQTMLRYIRCQNI